MSKHKRLRIEIECLILHLSNPNNRMRFNYRKKALVFILSFALANIALYSIINFHQYRIFGNNLQQHDQNFTKKEEKYLPKIFFNTVPHFNSTDLLSINPQG
jgi:hypothetical protein